MERRIAITGASGFIGGHLVEAIRRRNWRPVVLMRGHPGALLRPATDLEIVPGDLGDRAALGRLVKGADCIIHAAGAVKALGAAQFFEINTLGTERLLNAAQSANPNAPFIHLSSLAAREPRLSPYAASKRASEDKVALWAGPRPWMILRPPAVYGPGDLALLPLFRLARYGFIPYPAAEGARFSLIHVADLADAIVALIDAEWRGNPVLEIDDGTEGGHDWAQTIACLQALAGRKLRSWRLPRASMIPIALATQSAARFTGRPHILSPAKLNELYQPDWVARHDDVRMRGNWRPRHDLAHGFADTWNWYRDQGLLSRAQPRLPRNPLI